MKRYITEVISDTNIGGAGVLLCSIVGALADEFDFEVILPRGSSLRKRLPESVKITELDITGDRSFAARDVGTFYKHFRSSRPAVIHTHASLSSRIAARLAGVPKCISTRHCSIPEGDVKKRTPLCRAIYRLSTDLTVSTADFATANLVREGVPPSRIITIKNGSPDLKKLVTGRDLSVFSELGIDSSRRIIGSVARLERVKGQDLILRCAPRVLLRYPDVLFLFIGEGSMRAEYERLASRLGLGNSVRFIGFKPHPERYQSTFFVNVNASRGTETSCLATSECMSLGIPTVASDFGGNTEMITDGENGLIFKNDNPYSLADTLLRILSDQPLHKRLSDGARLSFGEQFSLDKMIDSYRDVYNSFIY